MSESPIRVVDVGGILEIGLKGGEDQGLTRCRKCRLLYSCENIGITVLTFALGGLGFNLFSAYAGGFYREGLWLFFALGVFAWLLALSFVVRTCVVIQSGHKENPGLGQPEKAKPTVVCARMKMYYNNLFDVNGKYYLTKMYAAELLEHAQQMYSLTNIYVCLMPVEVSSIVCAVLIVELLINIWATFRMVSQEIRNRLVFLDILTDAFCMIFPVAYSRFSLRMPIHLDTMLLVVMYPTISILSKLNDVWEDYFYMDLERMKRTINTRRNSRRLSILNLPHNRDTLTTQLQHFPKWLRYGFTVVNVGFVLFFGSIIGIHLTTQHSESTCIGMFTSKVWQGCQVSVPFCQDVSVAHCDCAVMEITNYTRTALPESFGRLSSLMKLGVVNGRLEQLPQSLGNNHKRLVYLGILGNRLESLPDSVGELQYLLKLQVSNNRLESLPESVGNLQNLVDFYVFNNRLKYLPKSMGNLQNLLDFFAWNNTLASLPQTVGNMKSLVTVDVRHNSLPDLPSSVSQWSSVEYLYLAGNPMCQDLNIPMNLRDSKGLCQHQCSVDCYSEWLGDGICDDNDYAYGTVPINAKQNSGCNIAACEYDNRDCPR